MHQITLITTNVLLYVQYWYNAVNVLNVEFQPNDIK